MLHCFPDLLIRRTGFSLVALTLIAALAIGDSDSAAQSSTGENWAAKMFKTTSHDFRAVGRGAKCEYHFDFSNLYEENVHIAAVRSSCGCTTPKLTQNTLKTHEKASVVATFNTSTFIGKKSAIVTVVFDQPSYAEVQLKVSGFIRTDITFDPAEIAFGEIASGEGTQQDIVITHTGKTNWQITDVRSHCDDLQVQLSPPKKTPGMVRYRMRVSVLASMPEGDVRQRLTLISNDPQFPTTEMSVNGRIRPTLSISPAAVSFGTAEVGTTVERRLVVRGDSPFSITKVVCADSRFEFETPSGSKKLHFVKMRFNAGDSADRVGQEIKINTDLNGGKSVTCVVTGVVSG